ncbi:hypothetical protein BDW62DRAFT_41714 [Aspergillus aurantiobrunneus]
MHVRHSQISRSVPAIDPMTMPAMAPPDMVLGQEQASLLEPESVVCRGRMCAVVSGVVLEGMEGREIGACCVGQYGFELGEPWFEMSSSSSDSKVGSGQARSGSMCRVEEHEDITKVQGEGKKGKIEAQTHPDTNNHLQKCPPGTELNWKESENSWGWQPA